MCCDLTDAMNENGNSYQSDNERLLRELKMTKKHIDDKIKEIENKIAEEELKAFDEFFKCFE